MRARAVVRENAHVDPETRATTAFVLLILAALVLFVTPSYAGVGVIDHELLAIGALPDGDLRVEPWRDGDLARLRHLRYDTGSTCTEIAFGPFDTMLCR